MNINTIKSIFAASSYTYRGEQFGQHEWISPSNHIVTGDWNGSAWTFCQFDKAGNVIGQSFSRPEVAASSFR